MVIALLESSATLSGLLLVFLGFILTAAGSLDDDVPLAVHQALHEVSLILLTAFAIGLSSVAVSAAWLVAGTSSDPLYDAALSLFALQIVGLAAATGWTVRALRWTGQQKERCRKAAAELREQNIPERRVWAPPDSDVSADVLPLTLPS